MYLKRIELYGFKSFANKTVLNFKEGITAIVGPNGSGKSNVSDAVRWVLGEQRKGQLRSAAMSDVIFSGTANRKSLSYAYVTLVIDNADNKLSFDALEVSVTRRIYRSGESEYLINGANCRLKDILELFYDTGIGKDGYSIIGQGQIEIILSNKPEERRELFDEAAGIVKYKRRKALSEKKLESEAQNILRVTDILREKERLLKPLENQASSARIFLDLREKLKGLEIAVFVADEVSLNDLITKADKEISDSDEGIKLANSQLEGIRTAFEETGNALNELDATLEAEREKMSDDAIAQKSLEGRIELAKEQIRSYEGLGESHKQRILDIKDEIIKRESDTKDGDDSIKKITDDINSLQKAREDCENRLNDVGMQLDALNASVDLKNFEMLSSVKALGEIQSSIDKFETLKEHNLARRVEIDDKLLLFESVKTQMESDLERMGEEYKGFLAKVTRVGEEEKKVNDKLLTFKARLTALDEDLRLSQLNYHRNKSMLDALNNTLERYEGFGGSVKAVMEQFGHTKGVVGVVADIIKVDKRYETAIEVALGGSIQNIVTNDEQCAKEMIEYLKQKRAGRATFMPLTNIVNTQEFKDKQVLNERGVIGLADSLVKIEDRLYNVTKSLLGRIVVCDTIDNALKLAKKYRQSLRIVTLEGELIVPGGSISGGVYKNASNLLSRRRELDELFLATKSSYEAVAKAEAAIEGAKEERSTLRRDAESIKAKVSELLIAQNNARYDLISAQEKLEEAQKEHILMSQERVKLDEDLTALEQKSSQAILLLKKSGDSQESLSKELEDIKLKQTELNTVSSNIKDELNGKDIELNSLRQQADFAMQNMGRIESERLRLIQELEKNEGAVTDLGRQIEEKYIEIDVAKKALEQSILNNSNLIEKIDELNKRRETMAAGQKQLFSDSEAQSELIRSLEREHDRLNARRDKFSESLSQSAAYLWTEYELSPMEAKKLCDKHLSEASLVSGMREEIDELKKNIKSLGSVNVNAIEEYKTLFDEYTFLKTQYDDLVESRERLEDIIAELDESMRRVFETEFVRIAQNFDIVFKELFGGGHTSLSLTPDEDILTAGVRIDAQPPGKKLQNMMQLSGGEKALTAISLLFAIQNLKPSPFCLLDEIEAALDESNVGRFAKYLQKLVARTQFIVITHRRGTMEKADRLYGITMKEKGISALVSVDFSDEDWFIESERAS